MENVIDYSIRKTATKTHTFKLADKAFITFAHYRSMLLGKFNLVWTGDVDLILDVRQESGPYNGIITYRVQDVKSGDIREHGTRIDPTKKDLSVVNRWGIR